jgi:hypothetical protein
MRSAHILSLPIGHFYPGAMQFLCAATHAAFPKPGHHGQGWTLRVVQGAACFANVYHQL